MDLDRAARSGSADLQDRRDRKLVGSIAGGDERAFADLFERYGPVALGLATKIVGDRSVAEEVVQDVFTSVWKGPQRYSAERGTVRAWVLMQIHHRAVDAIRHEDALRRRTTVAYAGDEPDGAEQVVEEAWLHDRRAAVRSALTSLSEEHRQVVELAYFGGLTQSAIAAKTGLPLGTVKTRTLAALRRLRTLVGEVNA